MIFSQSVSDREWEPVFIFKCISFVADELGTPGKQCFIRFNHKAPVFDGYIKLQITVYPVSNVVRVADIYPLHSH